VDDYVDAAEALLYVMGHRRATISGGYVGRDEKLWILEIAGLLASRGQDPRPALVEARRYCLADSLGRASDEGALTVKLVWSAYDFCFCRHLSTSIALDFSLAIFRLFVDMLPL